MRFRGPPEGPADPARGKLVELQAFDGGRWRVFAQPRRGRKGASERPTGSPHVRAADVPLPRARPARDGYPYELGYSRKIRVRVR